LLFVRKNEKVKLQNQFVWFEKWVVHRYTFEQLNKESGYSIRTLKTNFHQFLSKPPQLKFYPTEALHLMIDGTYFSNDICLIVYRDSEIKFTQLYRISDGERYEEIKEDLENLLRLGITISSITCDGHRAILKAVKVVCKEVVLQRCLVHIQRECRLWLTTQPKTTEGLALLQIVNQLHLIKTEILRQHWLKQFYDWYEWNKNFVNEKTFSATTNRFWYKHKMVRRSFSHLKNALPNMFHYLENNKIPCSTNGLESFFGHLKSHVLLHRGLTAQHRKSFIKWYLYFRNQN
jgi:hypothetical protein